MATESELWNFIADKLRSGQDVSLLLVAESRGSSPGRAGYKMAVAADGELHGSIGGGVMEVSLVEAARKGELTNAAIEQVHRRHSPHASGMICSGEQTVILKQLTTDDLSSIEQLLDTDGPALLTVSKSRFTISPGIKKHRGHRFEHASSDFLYVEQLGTYDELCIVGGGHCSLALSELMTHLNFHIRIFDDRPELNTLEKNRFADEVTVVEAYDKIREHIKSGYDRYVVVMTLGYASDETVIRQLIDQDFKYFGVLGSQAKIATLMRTLRDDGIDHERLERIRSPIGIPINSHSPEEIAISIAAEIISVRNA